MKILFIPYLPSAVRAKPIAEYFAKAGDEVHMVTWDMPYPLSLNTITANIGNSLIYKHYTSGSIHMHKIRRVPLFSPVNILLFKNQIRKLYSTYKIDFIFSESYFNETEPPLDLPILYDLADDHEAFIDIYGSNFYKLACKILNVHNTIINQIKKARLVIGVSDAVVNYANSLRETPAFKVRNGVEGWVLQIPFNPGKRHSLVYTTNFGKWSEVITLIHTINKLKCIYPDITLTLIGGGTEISKAKYLVQDLGLQDNVMFKGQINNRRSLFEIVNESEVCLNISQKNRFRDSASPMKVFEYTALRKKIVSTRLNEVVGLSFPNIFFYDANENNSLEVKIKEAFESTIDIEATAKEVEPYIWENIISKLKIWIKERVL